MPKAVLRGLQAEHPVVKRAAVAEVFRHLGQHSQFQSAEGAALLQQCVASQDRVSPLAVACSWLAFGCLSGGAKCKPELQCRLWLNWLFSS